MIYLAQPYTHKETLIRVARFKIAEFLNAEYLRAGEFVYSPIVHCHRLSMLYSLPTDFDFWMAFDYDMISVCKEVRILQLPRHEESKGVAAEFKFALEKEIPVTTVSWDEIRDRCNGYFEHGEYPLRFWLEMLERESKNNA